MELHPLAALPAVKFALVLAIAAYQIYLVTPSRVENK